MKGLALIALAALAGCATPASVCDSFYPRKARAVDRCTITENCVVTVDELEVSISEHKRYPQCFAPNTGDRE